MYSCDIMYSKSYKNTALIPILFLIFAPWYWNSRFYGIYLKSWQKVIDNKHPLWYNENTNKTHFVNAFSNNQRAYYDILFLFMMPLCMYTHIVAFKTSTEKRRSHVSQFREASIRKADCWGSVVWKHRRYLLVKSRWRRMDRSLRRFTNFRDIRKYSQVCA